MNDHLENMSDAILEATHLDMTEVPHDLVDTIKQVTTGKTIILHQNGNDIAAVISLEDLHLLERLIEEEEDRIDIAEAEEVLVEVKEQGTIPWEGIKVKLWL